MATIRLQLIEGYFYPTDFISRETLVELFRIERFPESRFVVLSPSIIAKGHAMAVANYTPKVSPAVDKSGWQKIGGTAKSVSNPCSKCYLRELCDDGECGRKTFRLFSRK